MARTNATRSSPSIPAALAYSGVLSALRVTSNTAKRSAQTKAPQRQIQMTKANRCSVVADFGAINPSAANRSIRLSLGRRIVGLASLWRVENSVLLVVSHISIPWASSGLIMTGWRLRAPSPGRSDGAASSAEIGDFVSAAASAGVKAGAERRVPEWSATRSAWP